MKIILYTLFVLSFPLFAQEKENWFTCQSDTECIHIDYYCIGRAVNKTSEIEARKYYQLLNARMNCVRNEPTKAQKEIPYKVLCEKNRCKFQGIKPR